MNGGRSPCETDTPRPHHDDTWSSRDGEKSGGPRPGGAPGTLPRRPKPIKIRAEGPALKEVVPVTVRCVAQRVGRSPATHSVTSARRPTPYQGSCPCPL